MPIEPHPVIDPGSEAAAVAPRRVDLSPAADGRVSRTGRPGSLVARLNGLEPAATGWRPSEVEGLLFVASDGAAGRLRS